jgi:hypothetical protein
LTTLKRLAIRIDNHHGMAASACRAVLDHARLAGEALLEAKQLVQHGGWLSWLSENTTVAERTAQAYMRIASHWTEIASKVQPTADLTIDGALKLLSSPRKPAQNFYEQYGIEGEDRQQLEELAAKLREGMAMLKDHDRELERIESTYERLIEDHRPAANRQIRKLMSEVRRERKALKEFLPNDS